MRLGPKIFPDRMFQVPALIKFSDFIEVMATPGFNPKHKPKAKFTIHAPHDYWSFNPADSRLTTHNQKLLDHTIKVADKFKAKVIVLHAGLLKNKHCSEDNALNFLKKVKDPRIIIENQCHNHPLNDTPEKLKRFTKELGRRICFDFSHASVTAHRLKIKHETYWNKFLKLKPKYFHVCDGFYDQKDNHLDIGKGKFNLQFIKKAIGNTQAALEVKTHTIPSYKNQINLLKNEIRLKGP